MTKEIVNELITLGQNVIDSTEEYIITKHSLANTDIVIQGEFGKSFPFDAPEFYLLDRQRHGLLAHVGWPDKDLDRGLICDGTSDALSLNAANPPLVYASMLMRTVRTLERVLNDQEYNHQECLREFQGHWAQSLKDKNAKRVILLANGSPKTINELRISHPLNGEEVLNLSKKYVLYDKDYAGASEQSALRRNIRQRSKTVQGKSFIIRLPILPLPPFPGQKIRDWWHSVLDSLDTITSDHLVKIGTTHKAKELFLVIEAPYQDQVARFTIHCVSRKKQILPLHFAFLDGWSMDSAQLESHTRDYLLPRGGGSSDIQSKKVLLIGCGSIGCLIADQLASAGVGNILMSDHDRFCQDNLYRHSLSMEYDGLFKSKALAFELGKKYPFTKFQNYSDRLLDLNDNLLSESDLIILAIGSTTHEVEFNRRIIASDNRTPIINTWLEPYGIGGHATFTANNGSEGCFGCTLTRSDDPSVLGLLPNMNFIADNQAISKNLGTCGSLYLPYSQLHAVQTAAMASKLALRSLAGNLHKSIKVSWSCGYENKPKELSKTRHTQRFVYFKDSFRDLPLHSPTCPYCND